MTKATEQLRHEYEKANVKLRPESADNLLYGMAAMDKLNRYGRAEIEYRAKSAEGKVRHPFFKGIREDL